jgi:hypothetical protein
MADEAKKPEHDQDDNYSPEHGYSFRFELNFRRRGHCSVATPVDAIQRISIVERPQRVFDSRPDSKDPVFNARPKKRDP